MPFRAMRNGFFIFLNNSPASTRVNNCPSTIIFHADLEIQERGQGSWEFLRVYFGNMPEAERCKVRKQLDGIRMSGLRLHCSLPQ